MCVCVLVLVCIFMFWCISGECSPIRAVEMPEISVKNKMLYRFPLIMVNYCGQLCTLLSGSNCMDD